jgi:hypothetical protein
MTSPYLMTCTDEVFGRHRIKAGTRTVTTQLLLAAYLDFSCPRMGTLVSAHRDSSTSVITGRPGRPADGPLSSTVVGISLGAFAFRSFSDAARQLRARSGQVLAPARERVIPALCCRMSWSHPRLAHPAMLQGPLAHGASKAERTTRT